jgi:hypothetical protein
VGTVQKPDRQDDESVRACRQVHDPLDEERAQFFRIDEIGWRDDAPSSDFLSEACDLCTLSSLVQFVETGADRSDPAAQLEKIGNRVRADGIDRLERQWLLHGLHFAVGYKRLHIAPDRYTVLRKRQADARRVGADDMLSFADEEEARLETGKFFDCSLCRGCREDGL